MSSLAQQQQALLAALFEWPRWDAMKNVAAYAHDPGGRGLKAYQSNGHALAQRALQSAYPVIQQLIGEESFADLARALWHTHPPRRGDVGQWGDTLDAFMAASSQLAEDPYLAEVARAEWCLHLASTAAPAAADLASLSLLTTEDPANFSLTLSPGTRVLRCVWPVASIINAHLVGVPALDVVGEQLRSQEAQDLVIWREGLRPKVREAMPGEYAAVDALARGLSLADALEQAPALDFSSWFPMALHSGLVTGVTSMNA